MCAWLPALDVTNPLQATEQIKSLYKLFCGVDATQVEINPLGETDQGRGQERGRKIASCTP